MKPKHTIQAAALAALALATHAVAQNTLFPFPPNTVSTVPSNGDLNPYGIVIVPPDFNFTGTLKPNDILVSNFNNSQNLQGLGTTIVRVTSSGQVSTFFKGSAPGLTGALGTLSAGYVLVGNLPTTDGTPSTVQPGSIQVLNRTGVLLATISGSFINGPWGMAIHDYGQGRAAMFVSNVLDGTVVRVDLYQNEVAAGVQGWALVGSGYSHRLDPGAIALGPSGLLYDAGGDVLYVANSADNTIYALSGVARARSSQGVGRIVYSDVNHLHGPLDLVMLPNGHLVVANSDGSNADPNQPSELVEFTIGGSFVSQFSIDPSTGGGFGIAAMPLSNGFIRFAAVDDVNATLTTWISTLH